MVYLASPTLFHGCFFSMFFNACFLGVPSFRGWQVCTLVRAHAHNAHTRARTHEIYTQNPPTICGCTRCRICSVYPRENRSKKPLKQGVVYLNPQSRYTVDSPRSANILSYLSGIGINSPSRRMKIAHTGRGNPSAHFYLILCILRLCY